MACQQHELRPSHQQGMKVPDMEVVLRTGKGWYMSRAAWQGAVLLPWIHSAFSGPAGRGSTGKTPWLLRYFLVSLLLVPHEWNIARAQRQQRLFNADCKGLRAPSQRRTENQENKLQLTVSHDLINYGIPMVWVTVLTILLVLGDFVYFAFSILWTSQALSVCCVMI